MPKPPIEKPYLLIVEGKDDKSFFEALTKKMKIDDQLQIMITEGNPPYTDKIKAITEIPGFFNNVIIMGIVRDADNNALNCMRSIQGALKHNDLPIPDTALRIARLEDKPAITVMIMPDCESPGMLEDLCFQSAIDDPASHCVRQYFECLEKNGVEFPRNLPKSKMQVFLASRKKTVSGLGDAAKKGIFNWDDPVFDQVKQFLKQLIEKQDIHTI